MGLSPALFEKIVAVGEQLSRGLRAPVWWKQKIGADAFGPVYADWLELTDEYAPFVEDVGEGVATSEGTEQISKTKLTFFQPMNITDRDKFRLGDSPDEWNVMRLRSVKKPDHTPYMVEVWLGDTGVSPGTT